MTLVKEEVSIQSEFIRLGQFIKLANIFESGGMIKSFLQEQGVMVNGEHETRRGRKLYPGDEVTIEEVGTFLVTKSQEFD